MSALTTGSDPFIHQLQFRDKIADPLRSSYRAPNPNAIDYYIFLAGIKQFTAKPSIPTDAMKKPATCWKRSTT